MSQILGIDPGKTGYLVSVDSDGIAWSTERANLIPALIERQDRFKKVYVERQFCMGIDGKKQIFTNAYGYGEIVGALMALQIPFEIIGCKDWQKVMLRGHPKASGKALKQQYTEVAERLWPSICFRGPKGGLRDGKAAAALIAEYGRRCL